MFHKNTSDLDGNLSEYADKHRIEESLFKSSQENLIFQENSLKRILRILVEDRRKRYCLLKVCVNEHICIFGMNH